MILLPNHKLKKGKYTICDHCWQENETRKRNCHYREGGYGVVYKAKDLNDKIVAIKTLKEDVNSPEYKENLARLEIEKNILKDLSHRNIVKYIEYFKDDGRYYLVMEFLDANSLSELLQKKGRLQYRDVFDYIYQIGLALKHVHDKNLLHRDVHPRNIMIEKTEVKEKTKVKYRAVLIDFGVGKSEDLITTAHPSIANFTHPAQKNGIFDKKLDVYSLAACLYKALTNVDPIDSKERVNRQKRKEKDLILPRIYNKKIKKDVEKAILKGMDLDLKEIPSMEEWLNQLPKPLHWRWQQLMKAKRRIVNWIRNFFQ